MQDQDPITDRTSAQLYEQAQRGDTVALHELIERYLPQLHAYVSVRLPQRLRVRESSMDVVQSVCRELLARDGRFDFRGEDRFRAWLFTAALNKLRDKIRFHGFDKRDIGRERPVDTGTGLAASFVTPSMNAIGRETAAALEAALDALSEEHREVITMARIVRLPHRVIAEVLGRSEDAARQLLARAMLRLTQELGRRGVRLP
ncbi:MAG: sigma-70 family RNA polymerase sigma factor [Planctomycetes bacterium]|nr:sigma-70 family RNA polymerase sigma factor [Planctomycetota bacterium]